MDDIKYNLSMNVGDFIDMLNDMKENPRFNIEKTEEDISEEQFKNDSKMFSNGYDWAIDYILNMLNSTVDTIEYETESEGYTS